MTRDRPARRRSAHGWPPPANPIAPPPASSTPLRVDDPAVAGEVIARANKYPGGAARADRGPGGSDITRVGPRPEPRLPGPVARLARFAARATWKRISPETDFASAREEFKQRFRHLAGEGFVELAAGGYQIDFGGCVRETTAGQSPPEAPGRPEARATGAPGEAARRDGCPARRPRDGTRDARAVLSLSWQAQSISRSGLTMNTSGGSGPSGTYRASTRGARSCAHSNCGTSVARTVRLQLQMPPTFGRQAPAQSLPVSTGRERRGALAAGQVSCT